jgi:hypothetical protein
MAALDPAAKFLKNSMSQPIAHAVPDAAFHDERVLFFGGEADTVRTAEHAEVVWPGSEPRHGGLRLARSFDH